MVLSTRATLVLAAIALGSLLVAPAAAEMVEDFESYDATSSWTPVAPWTQVSGANYRINSGISTYEPDPVNGPSASGTKALSSVAQYGSEKIRRSDLTAPIPGLSIDMRCTASDAATQGMYLQIGASDGVNAVSVIRSTSQTVMECSENVTLESSGSTTWATIALEFDVVGGALKVRGKVDDNAFSSWYDVGSYYAVTCGYGADELDSVTLFSYNGKGQFDNLYVVPEPVTLAVLFAGGTMVLWRRRRQ